MIKIQDLKKKTCFKMGRSFLGVLSIITTAHVHALPMSREVVVYTMLEKKLTEQRGPLSLQITFEDGKTGENSQEEVKFFLEGFYQKMKKTSVGNVNIVWKKLSLQKGKISKNFFLRNIESKIYMTSIVISKKTRIVLKGKSQELLFCREYVRKKRNKSLLLKGKTFENLSQNKNEDSKSLEKDFSSQGVFSGRESFLQEKKERGHLRPTSFEKDTYEKLKMQDVSFLQDRKGRRKQDACTLHGIDKEASLQRTTFKKSKETGSLEEGEDSWDVEVLKEGCPVRIDDKEDVAIVQTRSIIRKNGVIHKEEPCSDSNERYRLKREYAQCEDKIFKEEGIVHPQYKRYWVNEEGNIQIVDQECRLDLERIFEILEDEEACDILPDFDQMMAQKMSELYYKNLKKRRVVLEGCRPSRGESRLKLEKIFCGYHHDFEEGKSTPQTRIVTFIKGQQKRITPCSNDGEPLAHQVSTLGCDPILERSSGKKFSQTRVMIESDKGPLFLTKCAPAQELEETWEGCEEKFSHNIEVGQSQGYTRFFYKKGSEIEYVSECAPSKNVFLHQMRLVGYIHDDMKKSSRPTYQVYITPPYGGEVLIGLPKTMEDGAPMAYIPEETQEELDVDDAFYEGCFEITPRYRIQVYRRPDKTFYKERIGKGSFKKSSDLCKRSEETREIKSSSWILNIKGKPYEDAWHLPGSHAGKWMTCQEASQRASWPKSGGFTFFLYYYSFFEKRLKTEFPNGAFHFEEWKKCSPPQVKKTQTCHHT